MVRLVLGPGCREAGNNLLHLQFCMALTLLSPSGPLLQVLCSLEDHPDLPGMYTACWRAAQDRGQAMGSSFHQLQTSYFLLCPCLPPWFSGFGFQRE